MDEPTYSSFGQIDFILVSREWTKMLKGVHSDRARALASHHFVVLATVFLQVSKTLPRQVKHKLRVNAQRDACVANRFVQPCAEHTQSRIASVNDDVNVMYGAIRRGFKEAAIQVLPTATVAAMRPWISVATLDLITQRNEAQQSMQASTEKALSNKIQQ